MIAQFTRIAQAVVGWAKRGNALIRLPVVFAFFIVTACPVFAGRSLTDQNCSVSRLELSAAPPTDAYAVTGDLLPPFLKEVISVWNRQFHIAVLSTNSVVFVIHPDEFYYGLKSEKKAWLMSRELLGIQNFPLIINPCTPNDAWYLRAQDEWKAGNPDAVDILLTMLFREVSHPQRAEEEREDYADYGEQLALLDRLRKEGRLQSLYALACYASVRDYHLNLIKRADPYRRADELSGKR